MVERMVTDWDNRLLAAMEAIELLDRAGFFVHDFSVDEDAEDCTFDIDVTLSVGEMTYPLEALEDDDDQDTDLGDGFALGLTAGIMAGGCGPCDRDDCPRGE